MSDPENVKKLVAVIRIVWVTFSKTRCVTREDIIAALKELLEDAMHTVPEN